MHGAPKSVLPRAAPGSAVGFCRGIALILLIGGNRQVAAADAQIEVIGNGKVTGKASTAVTAC